MLWKILNQRLVKSILRSGELDNERKSKCVLNLTQKVKKLTPFYTIFNVLGKSGDVWEEEFHVLNLGELDTKLIKLFYNFKVRKQGAS